MSVYYYNGKFKLEDKNEIFFMNFGRGRNLFFWLNKLGFFMVKTGVRCSLMIYGG